MKTDAQQSTSGPSLFYRSTRQSKKLFLSSNQISCLPNSFANLSNLKHLDIANNPIDEQEQKRIKKMLPKCNIVFANIFF